MTALEVGYGDIVQIDPKRDSIFGGCYVFVEKVNEKGIDGFINIPGNRKQHIHKLWDDIEWCGQSIWEKK
jgi:hypothetical protein